MSRSLGELEVAFAQAANVDEQRQVVDEVRLAHESTQARYRGALKGVWIGTAIMVGAVVLAVFFGGDYKLPLIMMPAGFFVLFVFAGFGLGVAKMVHGYRHSKIIELQENTIRAAEQHGPA